MNKLTLSPLIKTREHKRWDWAQNPVAPQGQTIVCPYVKCGRIFHVPIELTVRANGSLETYHACPHCFSRVRISCNSEEGLSRVASKDIEKNDDVRCSHFLGYLKTRPKNASIPDECLTCSRIFKCM